MTRVTKISVGIVAIILFILIGWFIYSRITSPNSVSTTITKFLSFPGGGGSSSSSSGATTGNKTGTADQNQPVNASVTQITKEPVIGATLAGDGKSLLFYQKIGGNLMRADLDGGHETAISNLTVVGITNVMWAADKAYSTVGYSDARGTKYFNQTTAASSTSFLPPGVTSAAWSPKSSMIAYTEMIGSTLRVATTDAKGKSQKTIYQTSIPDFHVSWIDPNSLILTTTPTYAVSGLAYVIPIGGSAKNFLSRPGLSLLPAGAKNLLLYSSTDAAGNLQDLRLVNQKTSAILDVSGIRTLAEKCAWNQVGSSTYCAVPLGADTINSDGSIRLPDDWYQGKVNFHDALVKIEASTGNASLLMTDSQFDMTHLFLTPDEKYLYFINKKDSTLWRVNIGPATNAGVK
ncbi:MAG: hypothetical protein HY220_01455 [Candidatus Sungbacteria bacterium]|uniref:WD40 repeat domain-containing protein n=1 Tax=Candidatus Sungiibacteriota bacterium TaxID=2750080 RepID=A0A9D6LMU9_9BACT|nr:hypothetical protein [Candidatus Sungbacteria bacterium]